MTVGSLFSGIGGFDLGFERAGFTVKWMCEIDPFCRQVLKTHWPDVPIYADIRTLTDPAPVDCLIGGFPCQDISSANPNADGITGARSGLWFDMYRLICELRPRYVAIENVAAIVQRGLGTVLSCLARIGYDAEWQPLSAAAFGAPHIRKRIFIVAYPADNPGQEAPSFVYAPRPGGQTWSAPDPNPWGPEPAVFRTLSDPDVSGKGDGIPIWVDRNRVYGNAVVPQVAEFVGRLIMARERGRRHSHLELKAQ